MLAVVLILTTTLLEHHEHLLREQGGYDVGDDGRAGGALSSHD